MYNFNITGFFFHSHTHVNVEEMCYTRSPYSSGGYYASTAVLDQFMSNAETSTGVTFQYYASLDGVMTTYPSRSFDNCRIEPKLL